jgi:putative mRNA 3-end processing factor
MCSPIFGPNTRARKVYVRIALPLLTPSDHITNDRTTPPFISAKTDFHRAPRTTIQTWQIFTFTEWRPIAAAGDFTSTLPVCLRAFITHGHADHSRIGMGFMLPFETAAPVMRHRLGDMHIDIRSNTAKPVTHNGVKVSFHPVSRPRISKIRVEHKGEVWVKDYKNRR